MRAVSRFSFLLSISLLSACASDTILDLEIGDVGGLWMASSYEYVSNVSSARIGIIERDGTTFTPSVDDSVQPPIVGSTLDNEAGGITNRSGTVDIRKGIITLGDDSFRVIHDKDFMTLTNEASQFDFGIGSLTATVVIAPDRI